MDSSILKNESGPALVGVGGCGLLVVVAGWLVGCCCTVGLALSQNGCLACGGGGSGGDGGMVVVVGACCDFLVCEHKTAHWGLGLELRRVNP